MGMRGNGGTMGNHGGKMDTMGTEGCELCTGVRKCGRIPQITGKSFPASIPLIEAFLMNPPPFWVPHAPHNPAFRYPSSFYGVVDFIHLNLGMCK